MASSASPKSMIVELSKVKGSCACLNSMPTWEFNKVMSDSLMCCVHEKELSWTLTRIVITCTQYKKNLHPDLLLIIIEQLRNNEWPGYQVRMLIAIVEGTHITTNVVTPSSLLRGLLCELLQEKLLWWNSSLVISKRT